MIKTVLIITATFCLGFTVKTIIASNSGNKSNNGKGRFIINQKNKNTMKLGAFSMSLTVKDLNASKQFYENLGFKVFGGSMEKNYLIMKNENALIGLFHGMFKGNILTFNPGWDENAANTEKFDDVRTIQHELKNKGIQLTTEADEKTTGPASFMTTDPDGNIILVDQHR